MAISIIQKKTRNIENPIRSHFSPFSVILSESGHIAGIVNPPSKKKYGHYTNEDLTLSPEKWQETADFSQGSWWPRWEAWLKRRSGAQIPAREPGDSKHPPLGPAPGTYVKAEKIA